MSSYPIWDVKTTRELIFNLYDKEQFLKANQSLNSVLDRRYFAKFHYLEAFNRWKVYLEHIENEDPIDIVFLTCEDEIKNDERARCIDELTAHIHACVHSLHTIPDTLAYALYYAMGLNLSSPIKNEKYIMASSVAEKLAKDSSLNKLRDLFESIYTGGDFTYINALNNHGKHRSMVRPGTWFDLTGKATTPITLEFSDFTYETVRYARREIQQTLASEFERISKGVVDCGIEILKLLKDRVVKPETN